jgi:hypothetical protein
LRACSDFFCNNPSTRTPLSLPPVDPALPGLQFELLRHNRKFCFCKVFAKQSMEHFLCFHVRQVVTACAPSAAGTGIVRPPPSTKGRSPRKCVCQADQKRYHGMMLHAYKKAKG